MKIQSFYNHSPYALRVLAVSLTGIFYRHRRYGKNIEDLVTEVLARDFWTEEQWKIWQENRLEEILNMAATMVPYYKIFWDNKRRKGDKSSWTYLENWPILKKEDLRKTPKAFLMEKKKYEFLMEEHTSGSTGTPLTMWRSRKTDQIWYAQFEARVRRWNDISFTDRWAIFGGKLVAPIQQDSHPFWVWNAGLNQLYLSSYHISKKNVKHYIDAINKHKITYILGYPSALSLLASISLDLELSLPPIKIVITNAEMLLPHQKNTIQKAFNCRVVNTYGMSEIVAAGSECLFSTMHQWSDTGFVENLQLDTNEQVNVGESGRLICTGLINESMPLIRYEIGDWATRVSKTKCECGRNLPELHNLEGRLDDILITPDGRHIGRMDPIFKANLPIKEVQIIQEKVNFISVKVVAGDDYDLKTRQIISDLIQERMGNVEIKIEEVTEIAREKNGKLKSVISKIKSP